MPKAKLRTDGVALEKADSYVCLSKKKISAKVFSWRLLVEGLLGGKNSKAPSMPQTVEAGGSCRSLQHSLMALNNRRIPS